MDFIVIFILVYSDLLSDWRNFFNIRKLFCFGLICGLTVMEQIQWFFETVNPDEVPLDIIIETEEEETLKLLWHKTQSQMDDYASKFVILTVL